MSKKDKTIKVLKKKLKKLKAEIARLTSRSGARSKRKRSPKKMKKPIPPEANSERLQVVSKDTMQPVTRLGTAR